MTREHGQGARCTIPVLASPEMADLLDEAAQAVLAGVASC